MIHSSGPATARRAAQMSALGCGAAALGIRASLVKRRPCSSWSAVTKESNRVACSLVYASAVSGRLSESSRGERKTAWAPAPVSSSPE